MRHIVLCGLPGSSVFTKCLINGMIFFFFLGGGGDIEHEVCVSFPLQLLSETFLTVRIIERDTTKNLNSSSCKVSVILIRF
jgi:hypothetical protein